MIGIFMNVVVFRELGSSSKKILDHFNGQPGWTGSIVSSEAIETE